VNGYNPDMTLHYRLDAEDMGGLSNWYYTQMEEGKKIIRRSTTFLTMIFSALFFITFINAPSSIQWIVATIGLLSCLFFVAVYPRRLRNTLSANSIKGAAKPENAGYVGQKTVEINEEGIISISERATALYKWSAINQIITTPDHAFLMLGSLQALVIPRSKVEEGNFDAFIAEATRLHQLATGNKVAQRLPAV